MDFSDIIRDKHKELRQLRDVDGIDLVLRHLNSAEKHFINAQATGESELFTDVIYRANQVFEGILKEAYQIIADCDGSRKTPAQIESYFTKNKKFRPRVLEYFNLYRREWRNPSTHNHRLDFDEQEAFLAYSTVCGFCFAAINQMIQELASQTTAAGRTSSIVNINAESISNLLAAELPSLIGTLMSGASVPRISEATLVGALQGLIKASGNGLEALIEPILKSGDQHLRADLVVSKKNDQLVVVEVKRLDRVSDLPALKQQLASYAYAAKATGAIGVIVPTGLTWSQNISFESKRVEESLVPTFLVLSKKN